MTVDKTGVDKLGINRTQRADEQYSYIPLRYAVCSAFHCPREQEAFMCEKFFI